MLVDGETALLAGVNDHAAFASAIERLLSDSRLAKRLGDGAREAIRKYQSWEDIAQLSVDNYQDLIRHKPG
jgi:glycosyltransferase involved in cell wall biosynthesis